MVRKIEPVNVFVLRSGGSAQSPAELASLLDRQPSLAAELQKSIEQGDLQAWLRSQGWPTEANEVDRLRGPSFSVAALRRILKSAPRLREDRRSDPGAPLPRQRDEEVSQEQSDHSPSSSSPDSDRGRPPESAETPSSPGYSVPRPRPTAVRPVRHSRVFRKLISVGVTFVAAGLVVFVLGRAVVTLLHRVFSPRGEQPSRLLPRDHSANASQTSSNPQSVAAKPPANKDVLRPSALPVRSSRPSPDSIRKEILSRLRANRLNDITVTVDPRLNVVLTGKVWDDEEIARALQLARSVTGTGDVTHNIVNVKRRLNEEFQKGRFVD